MRLKMNKRLSGLLLRLFVVFSKELKGFILFLSKIFEELHSLLAVIYCLSSLLMTVSVSTVLSSSLSGLF
jgi:hypothetical protein